MSDKSSIEWTATVNADGTVTPGATWNPTRGCTKVSAGCKHCYAETFAERWRGIAGHPYERGFDPRLVPEKLDQPLRWKRGRKIFVNSMSDLFMEEVPFEYIAAVFGVMAACPQHTFQILTKRADRMREFFDWIEKRERDGARLFPDDPREWRIHQFLNVSARRAGADVPAHHGGEWPLSNVHLGVSVEDPEHVDRVWDLFDCPASVRWVSMEPLLKRTSLDRALLVCGSCRSEDALPGPDWLPKDNAKVTWKRQALRGVNQKTLDWVVVGGESGPGARPFDLEWARLIVAQCKAAGVPVFVKQLGASPIWDPDREDWWKGPHVDRFGAPRFASRKGGDPSEWPEDLRIRMMPGDPWPAAPTMPATEPTQGAVP